MMSKTSVLVVGLALLQVLSADAQQVSENVPAKASYVGHISKIRTASPLSSRASLTSAIPLTEEPKDGRSSKNLVVPGKDQQNYNDPLAANPNRLKGKIQSRTPSLVFDVANSVSPPSDPSIAVGSDHVIIVYNTGYMIYDKNGVALTGELNPNTIFSNGGCCDLTVSYDAAVNRWVISYLFFSGAEVAVSQGSDPLNTTWDVYSLPQISDYQKLSVWSDGYYITDNTGANDKVWVLDRAAILSGATNPGIQSFDLPGMVTNGFHSPQVLNVSDDQMPANGGATVVYLQDDAWGGVTTDNLSIWTIDVDWNTPANSTVSAATQLTTTPFISVFDGGSFSNLAQPGGGSEIDALQATIMNQAQFRKFPTHNSAVFNFVIDTDASNDELAGIRWYELRQPSDNTPWTIEQEGTYTSPNGKHAWHASMMMDQFGNIGMGYSTMAGPTTPNPTSNRVSSYYTGRFVSDPAGTMTVAEELISLGDADIPGFRYGDYSKIDINPSNDKEFWFINEYMKNNQGANVVGVFQLASDFDNDIGVVSIDTPNDGALTANETVTITVFNYGLMAASGFDVSYQIDAGQVITEPFVGSIASASSAQHTFTTNGDFSTIGQNYQVTSYTTYGQDQLNLNDTTIRSITHLQPSDVGVVSLSSPVSGSGLGAAETVSIEIENFGSGTQTSIPVYYSVNGGTQVQETYTGSIAQGQSDTYTFTTTVDLSALGTYTILGGTSLGGDSDAANDTASVTVENSVCQPSSNCAGYDDGVTILNLADQNLTTTCGTNPDGYAYEPNIVFNFMMADNPFNATLQMGYDNSDYAIWIDFNDNNAFESDEVIATGNAPTANTDVSFSVDFATIPTYTQGTHRMRVRGADASGSSVLLNPCAEFTYGRTNDYTANLSGVVGIGEAPFADSDLSIIGLGQNSFQVTVNSPTLKDLPINVLDTRGKVLAYYTAKNNGHGSFSYTVDMSYVSAGVYFVKVGDRTYNMVKRIVVR